MFLSISCALHLHANAGAYQFLSLCQMTWPCLGFKSFQGRNKIESCVPVVTFLLCLQMPVCWMGNFRAE